MGSLSGKTALVTGASRGLGKAIASELLDNGAYVLMCARGEQALREACAELRKRGHAHYARCDVRKASHVAMAINTALTETGRLDILVCNAGIYGPIGLTEKTSRTDWQEALAINLLGTVMCCQEAIPMMRKQQYGKIIVLSGGGATAPLPRFAAYAASKAGVVAFSATLAEELKGSGIDVNAIAPGALDTRLLSQVLDAGPERAGQTVYDQMLAVRGSGTDSRARAAKLVALLASSACDGITGRLISAVWDKWEDLPQERDALAASSKYTMRRVV